MLYRTRTRRPKAGWGRFPALLSLITLAACGGGGNSSGGGGPAPSLETGVFVDAPVEGLEFAAYDAGGALLESGVTNSAGEFHYSPGGTVTFSLAQGVLELGSAPGAAVVTPADLVAHAGATISGPHTVLRNLLRFLQTLDADGDPTNGILLPDIPAGTASSHFPDGFDIQRFAGPEGVFADTAMMALVSAVTGQYDLVDGSTALQSFDAYVSTVPGYQDPRTDWPALPTVVLTGRLIESLVASPQVTLSWSSTNASTCTASAISGSSSPPSASWTGTREPSGHEQFEVSRFSLPSYYSLTCTGAGGSASDSVMLDDRRMSP
jgi:hypothetical protein